MTRPNWLGDQWRAAIIGAGQVSPYYLSYLRKSAIVDITAIVGQDVERARARAEEYGPLLNQD